MTISKAKVAMNFLEMKVKISKMEGEVTANLMIEKERIYSREEKERIPLFVIYLTKYLILILLKGIKKGQCPVNDESSI